MRPPRFHTAYRADTMPNSRAKDLSKPETKGHTAIAIRAPPTPHLQLSHPILTVCLELVGLVSSVGGGVAEFGL